MTTLTRPAPTRTRTDSDIHLSFGRVLRSEWIKIITLRSTWWSLAITAVLSVGISAMIAAASSSFPGQLPAVTAIVGPLQFTMLVAGILGAIVVTGEYSTGMIRSTLTAEPRRGVVVAAKAIAVSALMAVATVVIFAVAIAVTAPLLKTGIDWSQPGESIVPLALGVLSMVVFTLIGLGFGFIVRNGAGAIAITVGVLFVLPVVLSLFSIAGDDWKWLIESAKYLPMDAAGRLTTSGNDDLLEPLLTMIGWGVLPVLGGWAVLRSRDV